MELQTAIEILEYHQEWRLGKREDMIHEPKKLTEALDIVLSEVKKFRLGAVSGSAVNFTAHFKDVKKEAPTVKDGITVQVYFICEGILYKGEYHINEQFYAYKIGGSFDCFASRSGIYKTWGGKGENKLSTHWCYVDELKMLIGNGM